MARMLHVATSVNYDVLMVCPSCPSERPPSQPGDRFCEECGTELAKAGQRKVTCSCTPERVLGGRYCPHCGTSTELLAQRAAEDMIAHGAAHP